MQNRPQFKKKLSSWISFGGKDKDHGATPDHGNLFKTKSVHRSRSPADVDAELQRSESLERLQAGENAVDLHHVYSLRRVGSEEIIATAGEVMFSEASDDFVRSKSALDGRSSPRFAMSDREANSRPRSSWHKGSYSALFTGLSKNSLHFGPGDSAVPENRLVVTQRNGNTEDISSVVVEEDGNKLASAASSSGSGRLIVSFSGNSNARKQGKKEGISTRMISKGQHVEKPSRIISLLGAATEIISMLGLESLLVGRSHECSRPESILSLPCVSSPSLGDVSEPQTSASVDGKVRELLKKGLARYSLDVDGIRSLEPDLIITQNTCNVCAVSLEEVRGAAKGFLSSSGSECQVLFLQHTTVSHVWENILQIAEALGEPEKGETLVQRLQSCWESAKSRVPEAVLSSPVHVACCQWLDPLMGAGFWVPEIVQSAGGLSVTGQAGEPTASLSFEELNKSDPDVIVVMCCGYGLEATNRELSNFEKRREWMRLRAVSSGRVFVVDGSRYFNSSGPAIVDSIEMLVEMLHGKSNGFPSFEGLGFVRWKSKEKGTSSPARNIKSPTHVLALNDDLEAALEGFRLPKDSPLNWVRSASFFEKEYAWKGMNGKFEDERSVRGGGLERWAHSEGEGNEGTGSAERGESLSGTVKSSDAKAESDILDMLVKETNMRKSERLEKEHLDDLQLLERLSDSGLGKKGEAMEYEKGAFSTGKPGAMQKNGFLQAPKPPKWGPPSPTKRDSMTSFAEKGVNGGNEDGETGSRFENADQGGELQAVRVVENAGANLAHEEQAHENLTPSMNSLEGSSSLSIDSNVTEEADDSVNNSDSNENSNSYSRKSTASSSGPSTSAVLQDLLLNVLSKTEPCDCLLLSGGLASDVLAEAWKGGCKVAITVASGSKASDKPHATAVAFKVGLPHVLVSQKPLDLLESELKFVVRTLRTFDPMEVRCALALAGALRLAQLQGYSSIATGDGAEELFTMYDFMTKMTEAKLQECRQHMVEYLQYPVKVLGEALGLKVLQPFLHEEIRNFALGLSKKDLMGEGLSSDQVPEGKRILRQAFPRVYAANRQKEQIEAGAGTSSLRKILSRRFTPDEFRLERNRIRKEDRIRLRDAEQLYYYCAFRTVFGGPDIEGVVRFGPEACVACGYPPMFPDQLACSTCGEFPARKTNKSTKQAASSGPSVSPVAEGKHSSGDGFVGNSNRSLSRPGDIPKSTTVSSHSKPRENARQGELGGTSRLGTHSSTGSGETVHSSSSNSYHKQTPSNSTRNQYQGIEEDPLTVKPFGNELRINVSRTPEDVDGVKDLKKPVKSETFFGNCNSCQCPARGWRSCSGNQNPIVVSSGKTVCLCNLLEGTSQTLMEAGKGGALEEQGVGALLDSIDNGLGAWHEMIYGDSEASSEGGSVIEIDVGSRIEAEGDEEPRGEMDGECRGSLDGSSSMFVSRDSTRSSSLRTSTIWNRMLLPSKQGR